MQRDVLADPVVGLQRGLAGDLVEVERGAVREHRDVDGPPVAAASGRQIGRASCTTSSRAVVAPASRSTPTPRRYLPRSSFCSTMPCCSSVATSRNAVLLWTPALAGDLGDTGLAEPREEREDGQRPVDGLDLRLSRLDVVRT